MKYRYFCRYVHSISYDKSWVNRARYWFNLLKQIKWEKGIKFNHHSNRTHGFSKYHGTNSYENYKVKDEDLKGRVKSEVVITAKIPTLLGSKSDRIQKLKSNKSNTDLSEQNSNIQSDKSVQTVGSGDKNNNSLLATNVQVQIQPQETAVENADNANQQENVENESESFIIIEPNISVVTITDEDNLDASNNVDPPEGENK